MEKINISSTENEYIVDSIIEKIILYLNYKQETELQSKNESYYEDEDLYDNKYYNLEAQIYKDISKTTKEEQRDLKNFLIYSYKTNKEETKKKKIFEVFRQLLEIGSWEDEDLYFFYNEIRLLAESKNYLPRDTDYNLIFELYNSRIRNKFKTNKYNYDIAEQNSKIVLKFINEEFDDKQSFIHLNLFCLSEFGDFFKFKEYLFTLLNIYLEDKKLNSFIRNLSFVWQIFYIKEKKYVSSIKQGYFEKYREEYRSAIEKSYYSVCEELKFVLVNKNIDFNIKESIIDDLIIINVDSIYYIIRNLFQNNIIDIEDNRYTDFFIKIFTTRIPKEMKQDVFNYILKNETFDGMQSKKILVNLLKHLMVKEVEKNKYMVYMGV